MDIISENWYVEGVHLKCRVEYDRGNGDSSPIIRTFVMYNARTIRDYPGRNVLAYSLHEQGNIHSHIKDLRYVPDEGCYMGVLNSTGLKAKINADMTLLYQNTLEEL